MRAVRASVSLVLMFALIGVASSAAYGQGRPARHKRAHRVPCALPGGAKLVARDAQGAIISVATNYTDSSGNEVHRQYKYCLRRHGGYSTFAEDYNTNGGLGDLVTVDALKLSGIYFAFGTVIITSGGRYNAQPEITANVLKLSTGRTKGAGVNGGIRSFILSSSGIGAWQVAMFCSAGEPGACGWQIQALDANTGWQSVLDTTPLSQNPNTPDPFAGPHLYQCIAGCPRPKQTIAIWTNAGAERSAPVQ